MASAQEADRDALLRQQAALAKFGELALKSNDLDAILQEGCRLVAEALGTDLSKIITCEDEGKTLFVRAGVGWRVDIVGKLRIRLDDDLADFYALKTGEPTIVANLEEEKRFKVADFLLEEGVRAFVNVPIVGGDHRPPFGILEVDSREPRQFTQTDISFLRTYANMMAAAVERHRTTMELRDLADQRKRLIHEIQHRLKNNLQSVAALVDITIGRSSIPQMENALKSLQSRVNALRLVHEQIYAAEKFDRVELVSYLRELAGAVLQSRQPEGQTIELVWDVKPLSVSPDIAVPLGLIVTEFITNSAKYAFDRDGTIWVQLDQPAQGKARLVLSDNGRGIGKRSPSGTGMRLIDGLAIQLRAQPRWESDAGTRLSLVFPVGDVGAKQTALSRTG